MDPIKPEKDELDLHQKQKKRSRNDNEFQPIPVVSAAAGSVVSLSRSAQWALVLIFCAVIGLAGMGYWQVQQQQKTIQLLDSQLKEASNYISQSKLIVARLEGQINQTDATMAQSGNELARELKFLDSELRKLWDVANKRNKEWIQNNQDQLKTMAAELTKTSATADELLGKLVKIEKVTASIDVLQEKTAAIQTDLQGQKAQLALQQTQTTQHQERLVQQQEAISEYQAQTTNAFAALQKSQSELQASQQALSNQLVSSLADFDTRLASQSKTLQALVKAADQPGTDSAVSRRLEAVETSMAGLDKVRGQLVQRIVALDARINQIQLEMNALQTSLQLSKAK